MSQIRNLTVSTYLSDGAGGYIEDGNGNLMLGDDIIYQYDMSYARIAGTRLKRRTGIKSVRIWPQEENSGKYALTLNRKMLVGLYPSLEAALGVLFGCYIYNYGRGSTFETWFNSLYLQGKIELPVVTPNVLQLNQVGNTLGSTLYNWSSTGSTVPGNMTEARYVYSSSSASGGPFSSFDVDASIDFLNLADGDNAVSAATTARWDLVAPGDYYKVDLVAYNGLAVVGTIASSNVLRRGQPTANLDFDVDIFDGSSDTVINIGDVAVAVPDAAASTNLDPNTDISYTYEWWQSVPTLTGITVTRIN